MKIIVTDGVVYMRAYRVGLGAISVLVLDTGSDFIGVCFTIIC